MRLGLVPRERRFYELFRQQGRLVSDTLAELAKSLLEGRSRHPRLRDLEHECDDVTREIYELVNRTFVAPLEQEDIMQLASALDDIVDLAEEISDKLELYRVEEITQQARSMGECLADCGAAVSTALGHLETFAEMDPARVELHRLENEGDRLYREALAALFEDNLSAAELIKWKDIYDLFEQALDRCERVADVLAAIEVKNV